MRKLAQLLFVTLALSPLAAQDSHAKATNQFGPAVDAFCVNFNNTRPYSEQKCVLCHNPASFGQKLTPQWQNWDSRNFAPFCNALPNSRIDQPAADVTVTKGAQVVFSGSAVDPDGPVPFAFLWNFPGGTPATSSNANAGAVTFNNGGVFTAALTTADAQGRKDRSPAVRRVTVVDPACTDADNDGYSPVGGTCGPVDCNDADPAINPGVSELCGDGVDNNCNGRIDTADSGCIRPQDCLAANQPPVVANDSYTVAQGGTLTVPAPGVLGNDTDPEGSALTAALVGNVSNGTLSLNANGAFTYTPNATFSGTDSFTYRASDGTLTSGLATVTLTVTPVTTALTITRAEWTPPRLRVEGRNAPAQASVRLLNAVTGVLIATQTAGNDGRWRFDIQNPASVPCRVRVEANGRSAESDIRNAPATCDGANRPPMTVEDSFAAPFRTVPPYPAVILNVLANDSDPDTAADPTNRIDPATVFLSTNPNMGGTASANPDGTISYRPAVGFAGTETFRYKVKDTRGAQSEPGAFVRVTVTAPSNRAPLAVNDSATAPLRTGPPYPAVIINVLANDTDPDTANDPANRIDPATVFITVAPNRGGTASTNPDGTVSYRPAVGFTGTETFRYKVRDTQGLAAEIGGIVSVTVGP